MEKKSVISLDPFHCNFGCGSNYLVYLCTKKARLVNPHNSHQHDAIIAENTSVDIGKASRYNSLEKDPSSWLNHMLTSIGG